MKQINPVTGICFFRASQETTLAQMLLEADFSPLDLRVQLPLLAEWFKFGCLYIEGVRQREDAVLGAGTVVRVHTRPKRFFTPHPVELRKRVVFTDSDFIVFDKPHGLPTHPTLDNFFENAKVALEQALEIPLFTTHRLDVPTLGLLILATNKESQARINRLFANGQVKKEYRALCDAPVVPGTYTHFMDPKSRVPKMISDEQVEGEAWWRCQLRVENVRAYGQEFLHELTLLTGKTHQIRAQMSYLGAPVIGDEVYGAQKQTIPERFGLECFRLTFPYRSRTYSITRPHGMEALQSRDLLVGSPEHTRDL